MQRHRYLWLPFPLTVLYIHAALHCIAVSIYLRSVLYLGELHLVLVDS